MTCLAALLALATASVARADDDTIVAKTTPEVVLIWRVNDALGALATDHPAPDKLRARLFAEAVRRAVAALPTSAGAAEALTIRLVYFSDGGEDPNYRIATVSGVRRVGELSASVGAVERNRARWPDALEHGDAPAGLRMRTEPGAFDGLAP